MYISFSADQHLSAPFPAAISNLPNDVSTALELAQELGAKFASPGDGNTASQWEMLATLSAHDLGIARAIEPHLDAVAILVQAGWSAIDGNWGVFAAEGSDQPLIATRMEESWELNGTKPWCSLASRLDSALITARTTDGEARLYAVDLTQSGVETHDESWVSRGLSEIPSGPVRFSSVSAAAVGKPGWYLTRDGFAWGGIGVAACWFGGAVGIQRTLLEAAQRSPNPHLYAHLGAIDTLLHACRTTLADAAERVDNNTTEGKLLAKRVRGLVARSCEEIINRAGHALGPAPLVTNADHAKRIADLQIYIRQHHAERDDASLGQLLATRQDAQW